MGIGGFFISLHLKVFVHTCLHSHLSEKTMSGALQEQQENCMSIFDLAYSFHIQSYLNN